MSRELNCASPPCEGGAVESAVVEPQKFESPPPAPAPQKREFDPRARLHFRFRQRLGWHRDGPLGYSLRAVSLGVQYRSVLRVR